MHTTLRIRRFNPEQETPSPYYQEYALELESSDSVLDGLIKVRETIDDSLALRCSCRGAICGSCGMRINGHARSSLQNQSRLRGITRRTTIQVEPMNNMPVIKDLVTDMASFWKKIRQVQPWLKPSGPPPQAEYLAPCRSDESFIRCDDLHYVRSLRIGLYGAGNRFQICGPGSPGESLPICSRSTRRVDKKEIEPT